ncbi:MAG: phosphoesterase RecJ domain protein [Anaerocolumna sp.]|jgi:phosphoesterase RecJ-like protein|nr:phosphoesterase RecJ domain protein [Anaerocolumna sp.]
MNNILNEIKNAKSIGISGHVRPDGDCTGSCMALYFYLKQNLSEDVIIDIYLEPIPEEFRIWEETNLIKQLYNKNISYDLFISLDNGSLNRLGFSKEYFLNAARTIDIDHHISNDKFADLNHVIVNASSTCEVLFDLFEEDKIDNKTAEALYLGIVHDTGVFKHSNTTEKTMNIAGKLIARGIPFSKIIDETFFLKTYVQNQILGRCLLESFLILNGKCIISAVSQKTLDFYYAAASDLDGIIDQLRVTDGVEVAVLIHETGFHQYKVSMRANGSVDVRKIAENFGGGGHIKAAGCTMNGTLHDVINNLTLYIEHQLTGRS